MRNRTLPPALAFFSLLALTACGPDATPVAAAAAVEVAVTAGTIDAGRADAGTAADAGRADAGTHDAGAADVSSSDAGASSSEAGAADAGTVDADASTGGCVMNESTPQHQATAHVAIGEPVEYSHNPPTSGKHWPIWGTWSDHERSPVPREVYVHNLEHGGIALLVGPRATPEIEEQLRSAFEAIPLDEECVDAGSPHQRALLVFDPALDDAVAVVAWDDLLEAECVDAAQVADFVMRRRGRGPEQAECGDGQW